MRIVFQQTILMKYHALFVIFEKTAKFEICLLQIIGGALRVKTDGTNVPFSIQHLLISLYQAR